MPYDEELAGRVRDAVAVREGLSERKMFGGVAFMVNGNMFAGVAGDDLMLRVGSEHFEELLAKPGARPMDFTGRPMNGYLYVSPPAVATEKALSAWLEHALSFVETLPAKQPGETKNGRRR